MMCHDALFSFNPVNHRYPTDDHERRRAEIAFLEVIANVAEDVAEIDGVANDAVRSVDGQSSQRWSNSKPSSKRPETDDAEKCAKGNEDNAAFRPQWEAWCPLKINNLCVWVGVRDGDCRAHSERVIRDRW